MPHSFSCDLRCLAHEDFVPEAGILDLQPRMFRFCRTHHIYYNFVFHDRDKTAIRDVLWGARHIENRFGSSVGESDSYTVAACVLGYLLETSHGWFTGARFLFCNSNGRPGLSLGPELLESNRL